MRVVTGVLDTPLEIAEAIALARDDRSGAEALFVGVVRDHDQDRTVLELEYSAHPSVDTTLHDVVAEVLTGHADIRSVVAWHRVGRLAVGDVAIVVLATAPHRREAFAACEDLVEQIKHRVPIWKRQVFADGSEEWVGSPAGPADVIGSGGENLRNL